MRPLVGPTDPAAFDNPDGSLEQGGEILVGSVTLEIRGVNARHSHVAKRAAQRARKAGHVRHRREVVQLTLFQQAVGNSRRDRFVAERSARREALLREGRHGDARDQFCDAHTRDAEGRTLYRSDRKGEFVRGGTRRRDHKNRRIERNHLRARGIEARRG